MNEIPNVKTQAHRCILSETCTLANTEKCVKLCPHLNALHSSAGRHTNAGLPSEYALTTLKSSPVRTEQAKIYGRLTKYVATFTRQFEHASEPIKSVYLWSTAPGTGKTTTASALLNSYLVTHYIGSLQRGLTPATRPVYFLDVNDAQSIYNEFNRPRVPDHIAEPAAARYYRMLDYAKSAEFAVLDDVGVRDCTEGFRGDLHNVVNHRVTNGLPTVYTSNLPLAELPSVFGEQRLYDRIRDQTIKFLFEGESKRGIRK
jgi:DNA replication protein DnaC